MPRYGGIVKANGIVKDPRKQSEKLAKKGYGFGSGNKKNFGTGNKALNWRPVPPVIDPSYPPHLKYCLSSGATSILIDEEIDL